MRNAVGNVDWLVEFTGTQNAPIARWEQRHENPYLQKLANLVSRYPEPFFAIAQRILLYANWVSDEKREPILDFGATPRLGSFQGGFPWTCDSYPWPRNENGSPMSPVIQLNLDELPLGPLGALPPVLFQVWGAVLPEGSQAKEVSRAIPLNVIKGCNPSSALLEPNNPALGFERKGSVGDLIMPVENWRFSLGQSYFAEMLDVFNKDDLPEELLEDAGAIEEQVAELDSMIDENDFMNDDGGFFGGQLKSYYDREEGFAIGARCIYSPRNALSAFSDEWDGLSTFDSGFLGVMQKIENDSIITHCAW